MPTERPTSESQDAGASSEAYERPLRESLEDSSVLLWYASREGKQVTEKTINDIVLAQSVLGPRTRDPCVEGRFWAAFRELAAAVYPASIDSILATYSYPFGDHSNKTDKRRLGWRAWRPQISGRRRLVDAKTTKKQYSRASIVVLFCLLIVQIYWFFGNAFRADLETHRAELDGIAGALRVVSVQGVVSVQVTDLPKDVLEPVTDVASAFDLIKYNPTLGKLLPRLAPPAQLTILMNFDVQNKAKRSERLISMIKGESAMLQGWDFVTDLFMNKNASAAASQLPKEEMFRQQEDTADVNKTFVDSVDEQLGIINKTLVDNQVEVALLNSRSILEILSQYILPLLYGLLGSLAYILRKLSREIQNVTFTRGSEIGYSLRWPLGMLGGVFVGLFFDPADLPGFAAITPLGLAFLAGYGVELLFTGLDRMVGAFTGEDTTRPKTP